MVEVDSRYDITSRRCTLNPALEAALITVKSTHDERQLYPNHSVARGGVGVFVATQARGSIAKLPGGISLYKQVTDAETLSSNPSASRLFSARSRSSFDSKGSSAYSAATNNREWEKGCFHVANFQSACRSARIHDVPPASKWAAISFYENSAAVVGQHMQHVDDWEQQRVQALLDGREAARARQDAWAAQQRYTFQRQRTEQSLKYVKAGLPERWAYTLDPSQDDGAGRQQQQGLHLAPQPSKEALFNHPPLRVSDRIEYERKESGKAVRAKVQSARTHREQRREQQRIAQDLQSLNHFEHYLEWMQNQRNFKEPEPAAPVTRPASARPPSAQRVNDAFRQGDVTPLPRPSTRGAHFATEPDRSASRQRSSLD